MKYLREKACVVCGANFMGGPNSMVCPECRPEYHRHYLHLLHHLDRTGEGSRETMRAAAIAHVRAMRKSGPATSPQPQPAPDPARTTCGYCGRELGPRDARRGYCQRCVARGYHWLHEVTGRTREGAGDELP